MKLTTLMLILSLMQVSASSLAQKVNLVKKNARLDQVFAEITRQTGYNVFYADKKISDEKKIDVDFKNATLDEVMKTILKNDDLSYVIEDQTIIITEIQRKTFPKILSGFSINQNVKLKGVVKDEKGEPLPNVSIKEKGTSNGTSTNNNGEFAIEVKDNSSILLFSIIGFSKQEKTVDGNFMTVVMKEEVSTLDEMVVVGYVEQKKGLLTGSVATMKMDENLTTIPTTAVGNLLAGKLAGVNVSTPNATPGATPSIKIRTESSWNTQDVLYVIDGVVRGAGDFNNLSPNEIDNISVLKDAAAAAVYGARSAGGIIVVTTKRGAIGKPTFQYSFGYSADARTKNQEFTSAVETFELNNRINGTSTTADFWSQDDINYLKGINNGYGYDHLKEAWVTPTTMTHNFSVNGGGEKVKYFASAAYIKQQGFLDPMRYDRLNLRVNTTAEITKNVEAFVGFSLSNARPQSVDPEFNSEGTYQSLLSDNPGTPYYTDGGQLLGSGSWNLMSRTDGSSGYYKKENLDPTFTTSINYNMPFLKGLSAKALYGRTWHYEITNRFLTTYDIATTRFIGNSTHIFSTADADITGYHKATWPSKDVIERYANWNGSQQLNFQLNYNNTFGEKHNVYGSLVSEWSESSGSGVSAGRETFPVYLTDQFWAASSDRKDTYGDGATDWKEGRRSYIGQFGYNYDEKYLFNFSFREDGSMKFAPNKRWGFFPAASVGWIVSKEKFFNVPFIDFMKFRGSVGLTGNDAVGGWQWQYSYRQGNSSYLGTDPSTNAGIKYGSVVNPNLTWEKALTYNAGVDINFAKRWNMSLDYWHRDSYDILGDRQTTLPTTYSQSMPKENYGEMSAQGFDLSLGYNGKTNDLSYFARATMSYGWNKVLKQDFAQNAQSIDIKQGKSSNYITGYDYFGILKTQSDLDAFNAANPNYKVDGKSPELGMMVYNDLSGPNGTPDGVIDSWDRVILRSENFPVVFGLNLGGSWKGFSLDMMFSGRLREWKSFIDLQEGAEWHRMWRDWYTDSWTVDNPGATLPKRQPYNQGGTYSKTSTFWYQRADFMRLKYLTLGYDIPKSVFKGALQNVRLFLSGTNLFVISGFDQYDPEMGSGKRFPITRSYSFGVDVKF
ncbi:SusC/RagA family TonB-linked outer membrane protein [Pedobacter foliorum]|uniref:SusC/RagA family TonB-linked outer membrane protein n=1 Tax=Pedobacter foliorum TaxID=2739058 RepID=UPI0015665008|nr:SusC/RagA family TonB-linked outer membrane protein [Pedobacter foliorum]NRF41977.1 SusC/RagA family TonB-linked outer membrane protein [Pedobacter foliorum]